MSRNIYILSQSPQSNSISISHGTYFGKSQGEESCKVCGAMVFIGVVPCVAHIMLCSNMHVFINEAMKDIYQGERFDVE